MQMVLSCTAVISSLVTQSTAAFHLCSLIAAGISNGSFGRLAAVHALLHAYQALIQGFTLSLLMVAVTQLVAACHVRSSTAAGMSNGSFGRPAAVQLQAVAAGDAAALGNAQAMAVRPGETAETSCSLRSTDRSM
jgi:hypothetical protein